MNTTQLSGPAMDKRKRIGQKVGSMVAWMLAVSILAAVALCVWMFRGLIDKILHSGITEADANRYTIIVVGLCALVSVAAIVICILILARYLRKTVSDPLREITQLAGRLEQGDLGLSSREDIRISGLSDDEVGELGLIFEHTIHRMRGYIGEISSVLGAIADGNLTRTPQQAYVGDFESIKQSLDGIVARLNETMAQIAESAAQVSTGSEQVSNSAQALAQGATQQASSVEQLSATISEISQNAQKAAEEAAEAGSSVNQVGTQLGTSVEYVKELNTAMERISRSSEEIGKIIAAIENIAFQTNILALNAAVEAARAGSAGKGFAVVADEVRNLANKSDEAAKATKGLIENSISAVSLGSEAVEKVTSSLSATHEIAGSVTGKMAAVVAAVGSQNDAIAQVTEGIDQISAVVQTNSATSEQSAAASEELSSQASLLKGLMSSFRLKRW